MSKREMLISVVSGEECRIALVEDGRLEELYLERASVESHVGSIYKGRVTNVEPAIQAAFVDFGLERNGFLHITDLHPRYFGGKNREETEQVGYKTPHRERPPIQKCLRRGQEILVQVIKEGIGSKGPTVTSYLSIPGRYLVMMPHMERLGVSRKVDDDDQRRAMRRLLAELKPPAGFGFIIRTAGMERPKTDLKRDLAYLVRLWKNLEKRKAEVNVGELYSESDLLIRTIRDVFTADIDRIIVDDLPSARRASDFLAVASPRAKSQVLYYSDPVPLFHRFGVEQQIESIHGRRVPLKSGGSLVIDSTEALVAVDVNSGKMRQHGDAETTAYKTNIEACDEVCRQLRLRDLGGVVVIDLIDMRDIRKRRAIENRFRDNLKRDRARTRILAISQFGILEMTRQRMRPSITKSSYNDCHYCHGEGTVRNVDSVVLDVMRQLSLVIHRKEVVKLAVVVSPDVAFPLLNRKRAELVKLEERFGKPVQVRVNPGGSIDSIELVPMDERGNVLTIDPMKQLGEPQLEPVESVPVEDEFGDEFEEQLAAAEREEQAEAEAAERIAEQAAESEGVEGESAELTEDASTGDELSAAEGNEEEVEAELDDEQAELEARAELSSVNAAERDAAQEKAAEMGAADQHDEGDEGDEGDMDRSVEAPTRQGGAPAGKHGSSSGAPSRQGGADREGAGAAGEGGEEGGGKRRRRRRRRRGRGGRGGEGIEQGGDGQADRAGQPADGQPQRGEGQPQRGGPVPQRQPSAPPARAGNAGAGGPAGAPNVRKDHSQPPRGEFSGAEPRRQPAAAPVAGEFAAASPALTGQAGAARGPTNGTNAGNAAAAAGAGNTPGTPTSSGGGTAGGAPGSGGRWGRHKPRFVKVGGVRPGEPGRTDGGRGDGLRRSGGYVGKPVIGAKPVAAAPVAASPRPAATPPLAPAARANIEVPLAAAPARDETPAPSSQPAPVAPVAPVAPAAAVAPVVPVVPAAPAPLPAAEPAAATPQPDAQAPAPKPRPRRGGKPPAKDAAAGQPPKPPRRRSPKPAAGGKAPGAAPKAKPTAPRRQRPQRKPPGSPGNTGTQADSPPSDDGATDV